MTIGVAIVEDDRQIREMLAAMVDQSQETRSQGVYASAEDALAGIPGDPPDVVLMDIDLPGMSGVECVCRLTQRQLRPNIIMLTVYKDSQSIFNALAAGAVGYLSKPIQSEQLLEAIRDVQAGGAPMNSMIARKVVEAFRRPSTPGSADLGELSAREREVLELMAQGYQYKEIAQKFAVSYSTVRTHVEHIYRKLHVRCRSEATARYLGRTTG